MDFDFSTQEGVKKFIITIIGIVGTILTTTLGWSPDKANVVVTLLTQFSPIIAVVIYYVVNQIAATGKAKTKLAEAAIAAPIELAKVEAVKIIANTAPMEAARILAPESIPAPVQVVPPERTAIPVTPEEWAAWKEKIKVDIDNELAAAQHLRNAEEARREYPELSSLNPSIVWSKTQIRLMDTVTGDIANNADAIRAYEVALLPAAEAALVDQQGKLLANGIVCGWKPSPMAIAWKKWCEDNIASLKFIGDRYDFKRHSAWEAGEIATAWVLHKVPWITTYTEGVQKNWIFPDKPEGYVFG